MTPPPQFRQAAVAAAREYKIPPKVFLALVGRESNWDHTARSPVGAIGFTQLMPDTAKGLGVNPHDPVDNLRGGAKYLRQQLDHFGSMRLALAAYNAGPGAVTAHGGVPPWGETQHYVTNILRDARGIKVPNPGRGRTGPPSPPPITPPGTPSLVTAAPQFAPSPQFTIPGFSTPGSGSGAADAAFQGLGRIAQGYSPQSQLSSLVDAVSHPAPVTASQPLTLAGAPAPVQPAIPAVPAAHGLTAPPTRPSPHPQGRRGTYSVSATANRPGTRIAPAVLDFVGRLAGRAGHELAVGTGTNHSRMTQDGNVSAHWADDGHQGHAVDIPATGPQLLQLGAQALEQAGMSHAAAQAAARRGGGLYNVHGWQIIFGNYPHHHDHAHIGMRR